MAERPPTNPITRFEHDDRRARRNQFRRGSQPGQARSDYDGVNVNVNVNVSNVNNVNVNTVTHTVSHLTTHRDSFTGGIRTGHQRIRTGRQRDQNRVGCSGRTTRRPGHGTKLSMNTQLTR